MLSLEKNSWSLLLPINSLLNILFKEVFFFNWKSPLWFTRYIISHHGQTVQNSSVSVWFFWLLACKVFHILYTWRLYLCDRDGVVGLGWMFCDVWHRISVQIFALCGWRKSTGAVRGGWRRAYRDQNLQSGAVCHHQHHYRGFEEHRYHPIAPRYILPASHEPLSLRPCHGEEAATRTQAP